MPKISGMRFLPVVTAFITVDKILPKYPIYIPSHGRSDSNHLPKHFKERGIPFYLVVDESQWELYLKAGFEQYMLKLPFLNNGTSFPPRVFIHEHSKAQGHKRHWQMDDNIRFFCHFNGKIRRKIEPGLGIRMCEEFCDQWTNVGIYGPYYSWQCNGRICNVPYRKNIHVYSCMNLSNDLPFTWRGPWNEDVDLCLQTLSHKLCTIGTTFITQEKMLTMSVKGGNSTVYQNLDSRAYGSRTLQAKWPGIVELVNKYGRPHFHIKNNWTMFKDIPLKKDPDYVPKSFKFKLKDCS